MFSISPLNESSAIIDLPKIVSCLDIKFPIVLIPVFKNVFEAIEFKLEAIDENPVSNKGFAENKTSRKLFVYGLNCS